jgi:8-oxo-dGTP pyrophosphatase MutT (NUDIX family)
VTWTPSADLLADTGRALREAPVPTAEERFEQVAWAALLTVQGPALLTRDLAPAHITASAVVLTPDGDRTCLVLHRKLGRWVQPGGHLEAGDSTIGGAAAREVLEETGLTGTMLPGPILLTRHPAPCAPGEVDWHLDIQYLLVTEPLTPRPSPEAPEVAWWPVDALPDHLAGDVQLLIDRGRAALLTPAAGPGR